MAAPRSFLRNKFRCQRPLAIVVAGLPIEPDLIHGFRGIAILSGPLDAFGCSEPESCRFGEPGGANLSAAYDRMLRMHSELGQNRQPEVPKTAI